MRTRIFLLLMALEALVLLFMITVGYLLADHDRSTRRCNRQLVQVFELTDLAIWSGARYTRHPSQADVFSAFQDSMGALEHFPEGTLAPLPAVFRPASPLTAAKGPPLAAAAQKEAGREPPS